MKIGWVMRKYTKHGSARYAVEITKYFAEKGHEIHVFCNEHDEAPARNIFFHKIPVFSKILKNFYLQEFCFFIFATLIVNLYRILHRLDLVYSQPGRFLSPDICGVHFPTAAYSTKGIPTKILCFIEKFNLREAKKIIAVSNLVKRNLMEIYKVKEEKIDVIHNGVNIIEFSSKKRKTYRNEIRRKLKINNKEILLLFVGSPFARKGLEYLIKALPLIKGNVRVLIIGKDRIKPYIKLAQKLNVNDKIIYIPFTKDIHKYFAASDIFVFPTLYEPFGLVILEAMSIGLPIITSCHFYCGAAELIENKREGLLLENPRDPEEISRRINFLLQNKKLTKYISEKAVSKAKKYNWKCVAQKWLKAFKIL